MWGTAEHAYHPAHIRHQCEQSLINLEREYIDIYYLHHGNFGENDKYLEPAAETLNALVKEGKIRVKGQSAYNNDHFLRAVPVIEPQVLQSWAHAMNDMYIREGSPVSNLLKERNLSFVAFSPLAQGILLDKYDPKNPPKFDDGDHRKGKDPFSAEALAGLKPKLQKLKDRFGETTEDLASIALRYVLCHSNVACVIPGFRNARQVACNLSGKDRQLSEEDLQFIRDVLQ